MWSKRVHADWSSVADGDPGEHGADATRLGVLTVVLLSQKILRNRIQPQKVQ